jgi:hypothetical protein
LFTEPAFAICFFFLLLLLSRSSSSSGSGGGGGSSSSSIIHSFTAYSTALPSNIDYQEYLVY